MYFEKRKRENRDKLVSNVCNLPNYLGKLFMMVILHFMIYQIFKNTKNLLSDYVNRLCKLYVTLKFYILDSVLSKSGIFQIKNKFLAANYPQKFLKKFIRNFENDKVESFKHYCRITPGLFDIAKHPILIPFCTKNEVCSKQFMQRFHNFTGSKCDLRIKRITRKMIFLKIEG